LKKRDKELRVISGLLSLNLFTPENAYHCDAPAADHSTNNIDWKFNFDFEKSPVQGQYRALDTQDCPGVA